MYYPILSSAPLYKINKELVEDFDLWLASIPSYIKDKITVSKVVNTFGIDITFVISLLEFCCNNHILEKRYVLKCPECEHLLHSFKESELYEGIIEASIGSYCYNCQKTDFTFSENDITVFYSIISKPNTPLDERKRALEKKFPNDDKSIDSLKQLLEQSPSILYNSFYNPSEEDYNELDGLLQTAKGAKSNTTEKGKALQDLATKLFTLIKGVSIGNNIRSSGTMNEYDCIAWSKIDIKLTIFQDFGNLFIVECKNEDTPPDNNYFHKLTSLMQTNGCKFGVVFSKLKPTKNCYDIARGKYLMYLLKDGQIIINICLEEVEYVIKNKINFLTFIEKKIHTLKIDPTPKSKTDYLFNIEID